MRLVQKTFWSKIIRVIYILTENLSVFVHTWNAFQSRPELFSLMERRNLPPVSIEKINMENVRKMLSLYYCQISLILHIQCSLSISKLDIDVYSSRINQNQIFPFSFLAVDTTYYKEIPLQDANEIISVSKNTFLERNFTVGQTNLSYYGRHYNTHTYT